MSNTLARQNIEPIHVSDNMLNKIKFVYFDWKQPLTEWPIDYLLSVQKYPSSVQTNN